MVEQLHYNLMSLIHQYDQNNDNKLLIFTLRTLNEYFNKTTVYNISRAQILVVETISLISNDTADKHTIHQLLGEFLDVR